MRTGVRYGAVGIIAYLFFLLLLFPASTAISFLTSSLPEMKSVLKLDGVRGTVWSGRISSVTYRKQHLGSLNWQLDFLPLLLGKLAGEISMQTHDGYIERHIESSIHPQHIRLNDIHGLLSVADVKSLYPYYPLQLDGMLSVGLDHAAMDTSGRLLEVSGKVNLNHASVLVDQEYLLGDFQSTLTTLDDGQIQAAVTSIGGVLDLKADASMSPVGDYRVRGQVSPARGADAGVIKLLSWLGKPDGSGNYPLRLQGRI